MGGGCKGVRVRAWGAMSHMSLGRPLTLLPVSRKVTDIIPDSFSHTRESKRQGNPGNVMAGFADCTGALTELTCRSIMAHVCTQLLAICVRPKQVSGSGIGFQVDSGMLS